MNVNIPEDKEIYKDLFFTSEGYISLNNYLKSIILLYFNQQEYPFTMPPVLGIPLFEYALHIKSEDEFLGRIKILGQILGIYELSFDYDDEKICHFNMNGEFIIKDKQ